MERFVFVAAVTFAAIFGLAAAFGGGHLNVGHGNFNIEFDGDGMGMAPVVETAPGRMEAQAFQGDELRVKHAAARITISPEDRQDFLIEIDNPGRAPMPEVTARGGVVAIDGRLRGRIGNCREDGVGLSGYGFVTEEEMPRISIRAPRRLTVAVSGASRTEIGATEALEADLSGCGETAVAEVAETLAIELSGSGDVRTGAAHALSAEVAGSGDILTGAVAAGANIAIAGSGAVTIASLTGPLAAEIAGSGSVAVNGGTISTAKIELAGSGDVGIAASVGRLEAEIAGSGDIDVDGEVGDIDAEIVGSGGVRARAVTGAIRKQVFGSGEVIVGD